MESQEEQGSTDLNPVCNPYNQMRVDAKTPSFSIAQPKEIDLSVEEHAPRIRKPYTITKQRERWTEEEHKKFLEALHLYGRAWRRIEEHIGTKTAVQIRSHAQKFFSKVVRESGSNDSQGTLKAIEIPPPRPRRKPLHPYPRKLGNLSNKEAPVLKQVGRTPLQNTAICEQGDRSPTSVLSDVGSETMASTFSSGQNSCSSSVASAAGPNDQGNGGQSPIVTVQEDNRLPPVVMEIDQCPDAHTSSEAQAPTLKLFGKTVVVTDSNKSSASSNGNVAQSNLTSSVDFKGHQDNKASNLHSKTEMCLQSSTHGLSPGDLLTNAWNTYPGFAPSLFYYVPLAGEKSVEPMFFPPPSWAMYSNLPFPFLHPEPENLLRLSMEVAGDQKMQREGSWTGSNSASISGEGLNDQNASAPNSKRAGNSTENESMSPSSLKPSSTQASSSANGGSGRGFVPYKRCAVESEVQHSITGSDDGENQAMRLCL